MWEVSDGLARGVFGLFHPEGWYEAHLGVAEFRGGKLVRLSIGDRPGHENADGSPLTADITYFPDLSPRPRPPARPGPVEIRGLVRGYVGGEFIQEVALGTISVSLDHITTR